MSGFERREQDFSTFVTRDNVVKNVAGHCVLAYSAEPGTSDLFNPRAFSPVELRRMARQQVLRGREIHVLMQADNGVQELTMDFRSADLSGRRPTRQAREAEELMELSDGFFFIIPTQ